MFSQLKLYLYGGLALVVVALATTSYIYKLKLDKSEVQREVATQQRDTMVQINKQIIEGIEKDALLKEKLYAELKEAREDAEKFRQKLSAHNLSELARNKPGLITRFARRATERVLSDIEAAANGGDSQAMSEPSSGGHAPSETTPPDSHHN